MIVQQLLEKKNEMIYEIPNSNDKILIRKNLFEKKSFRIGFLL
jgi:hypothetical protein